MPDPNGGDGPRFRDRLGFVIWGLVFLAGPALYAIYFYMGAPFAARMTLGLFVVLLLLVLWHWYFGV